VMLLTNAPSIQDVIFFPQMKPDNTAKALDQFLAELADTSIPEEWQNIIPKIGIADIEQLKNIKPGKLHQDLCSFNKKNKLNLKNPLAEEVANWLVQL